MEVPLDGMDRRFRYRINVGIAGEGVEGMLVAQAPGTDTIKVIAPGDTIDGTIRSIPWSAIAWRDDV